MIIPKEIVSKRLILRPITREDFEVFSDIIKDGDMVTNLRLILKMNSENNTQQLFTSLIESYNTINPVIVVIVINKESGVYLGLCGLVPIKDENNIECFYYLLPKYRGHGFAIEAMKKLIQYSFEELNIARIIAFINPVNSKAWKVAERAGMKYMGQVLIKNIPSKVMHFSIEKAEFEAQRDY